MDKLARSNGNQPNGVHLPISMVKYHPFQLRRFQAGLAAIFLFGLSACQSAIAATSEATVFVPPTAVVVEIPSETPTYMPTVIPSATPTPISPSRMEAGQAGADWLPYELDYQVYLPAGYRPDPSDCYPLLILLHGQGYDETQWPDLGIQTVADAQIEKTGRPFLIAMPREIYYLQEMNDSLYNRAVGELLTSHLQDIYPICTDRRQHAVGGISRGAAWAVHVGFEYPETFSAIGAHSLPPHRNDIFKMQYWVKNIYKGQEMAIYMDIGAYDRYVEPALIFQNALVKYHLQHEFHLNDGMHEDAYWQRHIREYIAWYASQWQDENSSD